MLPMNERTPEEEERILADQYMGHAIESPEDCHDYDDYFVDELPGIDFELYLLHLGRVNRIHERRRRGGEPG